MTPVVPNDVETAVPGWFGKLPMLGDFAQRRLPQHFVERCDGWMSQCLTASRSALGERWLEHYLSAPVWAFAWAPKVIDDRWWFGVMSPSVDAVGRYFPLLIALPSADVPTSSDGLQKLAAWYASAARCALRTLDANETLEGFEGSLADVAAFSMQEVTLTQHDTNDPCSRVMLPPLQMVANESPDASTSRWPLPAGTQWPTQALNTTWRWLLTQLEGGSVWWPLTTQGQANGAIELISGLPNPLFYARMLCESD